MIVRVCVREMVACLLHAQRSLWHKECLHFHKQVFLINMVQPCQFHPQKLLQTLCRCHKTNILITAIELAVLMSVVW